MITLTATVFNKLLAVLIAFSPLLSTSLNGSIFFVIHQTDDYYYATTTTITAVVAVDDDDSEHEPPEYQFETYYTYESLSRHLIELTQKYKNLAKLYQLGSTYKGRVIWAVKVSANVESIQADDKPQVLIIGAHHAREWLSFEAPMFAINYLLTNYDSDPRVHWLLDHRVIWFIPMLNPDGVSYMQLTDVSWRKNLRDNDGDPSTPIDNRNGVDLNRNYPFHWGEFGGTSHLPTSEVYCGPKDNYDDDGDSLFGLLPFKVDEDPVDNIDNDGDGYIDEDPDGGFSEPETIAVRDLVQAHNFTLALSFHSFGEKIIYPWSYTGEAPADAFIFKTLGNAMAELTGYEVIQGYHWYKTCGDFTDWAYGKHSIYAYTIEIGTEFVPEIKYILPLCELTLQFVLYSACIAGAPKLTAELLELATKNNQPILTVSTFPKTTDSPGPYKIKLELNPKVLELTTETNLKLYYRGSSSGGDDNSGSSSLEATNYMEAEMVQISSTEYEAIIPALYRSTNISYFVWLEYDKNNLLILPTACTEYYFEVDLSKDVERLGITTNLGLVLSMIFLFCGFAWGGWCYSIRLALKADKRKAKLGLK